MRIRDDLDRLESAEKALGLRDSDGEDLTEKVAGTKVSDPDDDTENAPEEESEGDSPNTDEISTDDAQPEEPTEDPAVEDPTGTEAQDGAPPRKYAGKFDTPEDLERAYQEALTLAGRHGQELDVLRRQAEQRQREAEEYRHQLQQRQQSEQQDAERRAVEEILTTPYDRLNDQQRDYLDAWAEHYGLDPLSFQAQLRILNDVQSRQIEQQRQREAEVQQQYRVQNLASTLKTWIDAQPDRDVVGPEVLAEIQRRPHLFNIPVGTSPEDELAHYQQTFEDLFEKARWKRQKAEADRQQGLVAQHKQQQSAAFDARRRAAGEAANAPAPRAPSPSAPPKPKSPVEDILDGKKRRTLANLING